MADKFSEVNRDMSRRGFLAGAGAAGISLVAAGRKTAYGEEAAAPAAPAAKPVFERKLNIGLIGCGGRGTWIADLFHKHGGYNIVAGADYFEDAVDRFGVKCRVPKEKRYTGLSCYKRLLEEGGADAVLIESPPYFHPEQAAAAVEAGKHVYLAKPVAVDVPGCTSIAESGKKAAEKKLVFLVDFQTRADEFYKEAVKRALYGDIGKIFCGEASYFAPTPRRRDSQMDTPEMRLRNWVFDKQYSGDIITEQNIHCLDVACWIIDQNPISCYGTGAQSVREPGDCWDHFAAIFEFPKDIILTFNSKQAGPGYQDILCRMYGAEGTIETHYGGLVNISGNTPYKGGESPNIYEAGAVANIAAFYENITGERYANTTVPDSVRSNLTTILGRTAAYRHGEATWDEIMKANEKIVISMEALKA